MSVDKLLQSLYDHEINFSISCFWDSGFEWKLGDDMNGYKEKGFSESFTVAAHTVWLAALEHYPKAEKSLIKESLK